MKWGEKVFAYVKNNKNFQQTVFQRITFHFVFVQILENNEEAYLEILMITKYLLREKNKMFLQFKCFIFQGA